MNIAISSAQNEYSTVHGAYMKYVETMQHEPTNPTQLLKYCQTEQIKGITWSKCSKYFKILNGESIATKIHDKDKQKKQLNLTRHRSNTTSGVPKKKTKKHVDVKVGDVVLITQSRVGIVRYVGFVEGKSKSATDKYIGLEIRITDGFLGDVNHGTLNHKTYFKCSQKVGLFIAPHQILQIYTPENLLEMVIELKDTLLPLLIHDKPVSDRNDTPITPQPVTPYDNEQDHETDHETQHDHTLSDTVNINWKIGKLQKIDEDANNSYASLGARLSNVANQNQYQWNIQTSPPSSSKAELNRYLSSRSANKGHHEQKMSASEYDADYNIAAPMGLMDFFDKDGYKDGYNSNRNSLSPLPPQFAMSKHSFTNPRTSVLCLYNDSTQHQSNSNSLTFHSNASYSLFASYTKLKLLHRCISLRIRSNKKTLVLDLAEFGKYLKNENINKKHKWYDKVWNKYDKLFKLKIEFYFVNELITDLLNEYLIYQYETINIENIMHIDIKKAVQQIIIHIRPYHIEQHQQHQQIEISRTIQEDEYDEMLPFTFNDFCSLGSWLYEVIEMEEDYEIEDYFIMDIHYLDFVQYINSHKGHVWKNVINKLLNKDNKNVINQFNVNKIANVIEETVIDYGRNGLGNENMKIYSKQVREYTIHLIKLFNECKEEVIDESIANKKRTFITKTEFFRFVSCIPSL